MCAIAIQAMDNIVMSKVLCWAAMDPLMGVPQPMSHTC